MATIPKKYDALAPVDPESFKAGEPLPEEDALKLVVQDADFAEAWLTEHYQQVRWMEADIMYQSPPILKVWEGTTVPRANISLFTVATHVNAIKSKLMNGLFYEDPPFVLRPRPHTSQDAIRAHSAVLGYQLNSINFRDVIDQGFFNALLFGTAIYKYGWRIKKQKKLKYVRKGKPYVVESYGRKISIPTPRSKQFDVQETEEEVSEPFIEALDPRYCLVDPSARKGDIRSAKYVVHKQSLTYYQLCDLASEAEILGDDSYQIPSEDIIREWFMPPTEPDESPAKDINLAFPGSSPYLHHAAPRFQKTTEDPLEEPLEVLERVDKDRLITVVNRVLVIRNTPNPYGCINYLSVNWLDIPDAFWGIGVGLILSSEQRLQQGITNATADFANLIVNPLIVRSRGANVTSQSIRQRLGGIVDVDGDVDKAFKYQEQPKIPGELFVLLQGSEARAESNSGANEQLVMGNLPAKGRTSLGRTATGASALMQASDTRIGAFVEKFVYQVMKPFLWAVFDLNKEFLPIDQIHSILNEELGDAFKVDEEDFLNCGVKEFEVLAGSHLAVKQQMAQSIALITQIFSSPQTIQELAEINQEFVDVKELLHMIYDVSGWNNYYDIVKPLTPEMKQRMQQNNPAIIQAKAKAQQQQQQHQNDLELINQKDINRSVQLGLRHSLEKVLEPELTEGQPGEQGFGSNETA